MHTHTHIVFCSGDKDQTISFLHKGFLNYSHMVLFREKIDGSLRGVIMIGIDHFNDYTTLKMGPSFFKNYYRGGPLAYLIVGYFILKGEDVSCFNRAEQINML